MAGVDEYAFNFYLKKGWSPYAAAGIVGNLMHESRMNPRAIHDNGTGIGIAGYRDEEPGKGRKAQMFAFAKANKLDPLHLDTQLEFSNYELHTTERAVGEKLANAKNVDQANAAMLEYERPKGYDKKNPSKSMGFLSRLRNARNIFAKATGKAPPPSSAIDTGGYDTASADTTDTTDTADTNPDPGSKVQDLLQGAGKAIADNGGIGGGGAQGGFDYAPAGPGMNSYVDPNESAIPVDSYSQYVQPVQYTNYAAGGNVEDEVTAYFRQFMGG